MKTVGASLGREIIIDNNKDLNQIDKEPLKNLENSLKLINYIL